MRGANLELLPPSPPLGLLGAFSGGHPLAHRLSRRIRIRIRMQATANRPRQERLHRVVLQQRHPYVERVGVEELVEREARALAELRGGWGGHTPQRGTDDVCAARDKGSDGAAKRGFERGRRGWVQG